MLSLAPSIDSQWVEGHISALFEESYPYSVIKRCKNHVFSTSKAKVENIINKKGKNHHNLTSEGKILNIYPRQNAVILLL